MNLTASIAFAFLLDLLLGDPRWLPHPVRWMGSAIGYYEKRTRETHSHLFWSGFILAFLLPGFSYFIVWLFIESLFQYSPNLSFCLQTFIIYQCISVRGLYDKTKNVYQSLMNKDVVQARINLSLVTGCDTEQLDERDLSRAVVETVGEGIVDGILSPLFFAAIGGAPLVMAYKAVSTLDSLIGCRNETYEQFGKTSARLDDLMNYVPARLSIVVISLAAALCSFSRKQAWHVGWSDRFHHTSPNSGHAEAAFAGALHIRLGGTNYYQGKKSKKPFIHFTGKPAAASHIHQAWKLMFVTSVLFLFMICLVRVMFSA